MLNIQPTSAVLGASITGIDLSQPLSPADFTSVIHALGRHGVGLHFAHATNVICSVTVLARSARGPAELESHNRNLVGGDLAEFSPHPEGNCPPTARWKVGGLATTMHALQGPKKS